MEGISIIVPSYNRREMLVNSLCGLQTQEHFRKPYEVVVVDNGSENPFSVKEFPTAPTFPIKTINRNLSSGHFQPGSARNIGVAHSKFDVILFLDSDCIPSTRFLSAHWDVLGRGCATATIGHREFISESEIRLSQLLNNPNSLIDIPRIPSDSNYRSEKDRRLEELVLIGSHPAPYNCFHGCNIGMRKRDFIRAGGFNTKFDLFWGYEDIELGHRLSLIGLEFHYVPDAVVFHQEGRGLTLNQRLLGRERNYVLASILIPDFEPFRKELGR